MALSKFKVKEIHIQEGIGQNNECYKYFINVDDGVEIIEVREDQLDRKENLGKYYNGVSNAVWAEFCAQEWEEGDELVFNVPARSGIDFESDPKPE